MNPLTYEHNFFLTPRNIPLEEIFLNTKDFQNRKTEYNEHSVQRIVQSVLEGNFMFEVFDPILLWRNVETNQLFVVSGHSRYEAFKRLHQLSENTACKQENLDIYITAYPGLFSQIPSRILNERTYEQAKNIAQLSNVLATPETPIERANYIRRLRAQGRGKQKIEQHGKTYEGKNRPKIQAYSYLNPNGRFISSLECFSNNTDDSKILERLAIRVGNARMRYPCLQDAHEEELYHRLFVFGAYGNKTGQVNSQMKFMELLKTRIEKIIPRDDKALLNMRGTQQLSYSMTVYYKMLGKFKKIEQELKSHRDQLTDRYQREFITATGEVVESYKRSLVEILGVPLEMLSTCEEI
ncbi:MAG: hypothetical protein LBG52_07205 [Candidatus Peribacteria bacterium]|jgi:hypothetical protein|nr:hypothetical protein [Candidatus Peribacteria bacterium]